jgi:hypothetical protein
MMSQGRVNDAVQALKGSRPAFQETHNLYRARGSLTVLLTILEREQAGYAATAKAYEDCPLRPTHAAIATAAQSIAKALGGTISQDTDAFEGTFVVYLPRTAPETYSS